jgi:hypothetical protein
MDRDQVYMDHFQSRIPDWNRPQKYSSTPSHESIVHPSTMRDNMESWFFEKQYIHVPQKGQNMYKQQSNLKHTVYSVARDSDG